MKLTVVSSRLNIDNYILVVVETFCDACQAKIFGEKRNMQNLRSKQKNRTFWYEKLSKKIGKKKKDPENLTNMYQKNVEIRKTCLT